MAGIETTDDLIDGIKRRIDHALSYPDASPHHLINALHNMKRFVVEWERRASKDGSVYRRKPERA